MEGWMTKVLKLGSVLLTPSSEYWLKELRWPATEMLCSARKAPWRERAWPALGKPVEVFGARETNCR